MQAVAEKTQCLKNIRHIGWMCAADLDTTQARAGYAVYQQAIQRGALLRPLGNTLYWFPPYTIDHKTLDDLRDITCDSILAVRDQL